MEFRSEAELSDIGRGLASASLPSLPFFKPFRFPARLFDNEIAIHGNYERISIASRSSQVITPAAEWLLDNHHLVRENLRQVRRDLPLKFYRQLPEITVEGGAVLPRTFALAWVYVAHTDSTFEGATLSAVVNGFQHSQSLTIGEIWAVPAILRYILLENLRRISDRVDQSRQMRIEANRFADFLATSSDRSGLEAAFRVKAKLTGDNAFSTQLLYRLREDSEAASEALDWLEARLEARDSNAEEVMIAEHARISTNNLTVGNIIRSLRRIDDFDWTKWFEEISTVDRALREGSDFGRLDPTTRNHYRTAIEKTARRSDKSEIEVAKLALEFAARESAMPDTDPARRQANVGYYLVGVGVSALRRAAGYRTPVLQRVESAARRAGVATLMVPVALMALAMVGFASWMLSFLALDVIENLVLSLVFAPLAWEVASAIFRSIVFALLPPSFLPGYEFKSGIPQTVRTMVVIPCLLTDRDAIAALVRNLEIHYLANPDDNICFALLSDWPDAEQEEAEDDKELLAFAEAEIDRIAYKYLTAGPRRFFLLHRRRLFNKAESVWMGWERKRGKLHELNLLLNGEQDTTFVGHHEDLPTGIQYILTLDSDTRLPRDSARKLIGKLAHPLNAPVVDAETGRVTEGYGILQPRITPSLTTGDEASVFQRIFSQDCGLDPYVFAVSDLYQDLFGEGSYTGKGLYHISAFSEALEGRIDENTVLSHDLLEGSFARCALVSDVTFVEDFPVRYEVELSRQHRWARGDWQLLPMIFDRNNGLGALARLKMLDNLRRSLMPVIWLVASMLGWCLLSPPAAAFWQLVLIGSTFAATLLSLLTGLAPQQRDVTPWRHLKTILAECIDALAQIGLLIAFMIHNAITMIDAIVRTAYRLFISRRHLLEWLTAEDAHAARPNGVGDYYRMMALSLVAAVVLFAIVALVNPANAIVAGIFTLIWLIAPGLAWWVSQSEVNEDCLVISQEDTNALRAIARRTWHYFETFVSAEHNYLPPDNFQEVPIPYVAHRTSPTNIGLYLISTITARDMGWISFNEAIERVEQTIATVERMDKHKGHLFNWYDTKSMATLSPRYISSVDSGNLASHLVVVSSSLREWAAAPAVHLLGDARGIGDTVQIVRETLARVPDNRRNIRPLRRRLEERLEGFVAALQSNLETPQFAPVRSIGLSVIAREIEALVKDLHGELASSATGWLTEWAAKLHRVCEAHFGDAVFDRDQTEVLRERLLELGERARALAFAMDFAFLFNSERRLLSIGYQYEDAKLDEACYDLLASEARLTSLFGIAKGDLPSEHWFRLGRPVTSVKGQAVLVSWAGSMFEYLMPAIVMHERQGGILNQSDRLSIVGQMVYASGKRLPWGVSESAYNARDRELNYQYTNFGVPALGLKRNIAANVVIAPYSTGLASQFYPKEAVANYERLQALGALGIYGYYDAVDFTESRIPEGRDCAVVQNYMAHHQGMTITAIGNAVHNGLLRDRFHSDPVIEAAELLLQEKAPRDFVAVVKVELGDGRPDTLRAGLGQKYRLVEDPLNTKRAVSLLSNGHYALMVTATGSGYSMWNGQAVTRWKPDPTSDDWGSYVFLRDVADGNWWSATAGPKQGPDEVSRAIFSDEKAEFRKKVGDIESRLEILVATESDAEARRLTIKNTGEIDRYIEVTSFGELVLAFPDSDAAHPVFSKMFVKTEISEDGDVIYARRNKRSPDEPDIEVAHLVTGAGRSRRTEAETDRRAFIGRGRELANALAFEGEAPLQGHQGFTLDPIFSLRRVLRIPSGREASVTFWTIAAPNRPEVERAVERCRHVECFNHESRHAWTRSQVQIRHLDTTHEEALIFQRIAAFLIYPDMRLRQVQTGGQVGEAPQSALWPLSISGDFPIFALRIDNDVDLPIIQKAFRMQEYLRGRGVISDLVIINERGSTYAQDVQHAIDFMCENARRRGLSSGPAQHIFSVRRDLIDDDAYEALMGAARIVLHTRNGAILEQIDRLERIYDSEAAAGRPESIAAARRRAIARPATSALETAADAGGDLEFWNGYGGFDADGRDYVIRLRGGQATPHPWVNVISNGTFGFHVSAEGAGFTWSTNSRDYQLTPWSNDPVSNRPGEGFYIHDLDRRTMLSPFPALSADPAILHETRHGPGYSTFSSTVGDLAIEMTQIVAPRDPAKLIRLKIANRGSAPRNFRIYGYVEWVLGNNRAKTAPHIKSWHSEDTNALMASNPFSVENSERVAFLASSAALSSHTINRMEFLGETGNSLAPETAVSGAALSGTEESGGDPCAAIAVDASVAAGSMTEVVFILGDVETQELAEPMIKRLLAEGFGQSLRETESQWEAFFATLQVTTPDKAFDRMVNTWLPYQSLACRIRARSAFYQASGAFGFRDQLQDTLALMLQDPGLARAQILNAASRQFVEGDVQHWWLPKSGAGVRTLISDDVAWLGYGVAHYVATTGDRAILDEEIAFLQGEPLGEKHESYMVPTISGEVGSLYEHCARALDLAVHRTGSHGLPLILGGDWNDGMNRVGIEGRGESTWLGWFLHKALEDFVIIARERGDQTRADAWQSHCISLKKAIESEAWDGEWYRRGYFDDGSPLGSAASEECRIDSIAQSWSVLSGAGDASRAEQAMNSVLSHLVDDTAGIVKLFAPPFEHSARDPGYIKGYPPGVRENGGQYTHAAIWTTYALARLGRADDAWRLFSMLNPVNHALTREDAELYRVEPYVVAADVYGAADRTGRGGWTWYTGSAGWLYRAAVEAILGINRRGATLVIRPALPSQWPGFSAMLQLDGKQFAVDVVRSADGTHTVTVNGKASATGDGTFELSS
ncbi:protein ndvB [Rhizobium sp. KVB221]|uniref:Protein ndvB n=1 Tax=Rhizobium setariae TaxID=2801340 RepID=A0A937CNC0_9HYPH|nr:glucoamylase family protein [Rhizobium setariae]MBL0370522.1 protein ndvB [Rhizobium setariae]